MKAPLWKYEEKWKIEKLKNERKPVMYGREFKAGKDRRILINITVNLLYIVFDPKVREMRKAINETT